MLVARRRLEVAVDHAGGVRVHERPCDVDGDQDRFTRRKGNVFLCEDGEAKVLDFGPTCSALEAPGVARPAIHRSGVAIAADARAMRAALNQHQKLRVEIQRANVSAAYRRVSQPAPGPGGMDADHRK